VEKKASRMGVSAANRKKHGAKAPMSLVPIGALEGVAHVMQHGNTKYGPWNWREAATATVPEYLSAALRHLGAIEDDPLALDGDSGLPAIDHAIASLLIARWHTMHPAPAAEKPEPIYGTTDPAFSGNWTFVKYKDVP